MKRFPIDFSKPIALTVGMAGFINKVMRTWSDDLKREFEREFRKHYQGYFDQFMASDEQDEGVAAGVHNLIDQEIERHRDQYRDIKCKKGCSACCHQLVQITHAEARLLALCVTEGEIRIDRELLARQASGPEDETDWWRLPMEENGCVFLDRHTGKCRVYEHRPTACRKYFVTSDPHWCGTREGNQRVSVINMYPVEIVASAALNCDHQAGPLPRLLAQALAENDTLLTGRGAGKGARKP